MKITATTYKRMAALAIVCSMFSLAFACNVDQYRKAGQLARDFAAGVQAFQDTEIALHNSGKVSEDEHTKIQGIIVQVATAGQALDKAINTTHNAAGANDALNAALTALDQLNADGVLHIVNPDAKAALSATLVTLHTILDSIKAFAS